MGTCVNRLVKRLEAFIHLAFILKSQPAHGEDLAILWMNLKDFISSCNRSGIVSRLQCAQNSVF